MALIVQKYGGTSVGTTERIQNVAQRILQTQREGNQVVAVVSAMAGVTDNLTKLAHAIAPQPTEREIDVLLATGEQTTIALTAMAINALGGKAISLTGAQAGITTNGAHTKARISNITPEEVHRFLDEGNIVIIAGFQGKSTDGRITTLGRGGTDLTAIAMSAAIRADYCQIFTDVDGVFTCDPRIVTDAKKIDEISYDEMMELASSGAKVMQSRAVEFAKKFGVKFEVRNSFNNNPGTQVIDYKKSMESIVIRGISIEKNQAKISIEELPNTPGINAKIFDAVTNAEIVVDMIIQNITHKTGNTHLSFTLHHDDLDKVKNTLKPLLTEIDPAIICEAKDGLAKLGIVGIGMQSHFGVASKAFDAVAEKDIEIEMVSTSDIKIEIAVKKEDAVTAAKAIHDAFDLGEK